MRDVTIAAEQTASVLAEGERKTVTALFADLKGSTELIHDLDPERARSIIDPALKAMVDAVRQYDGYVVQSTGDGIFALFGAPLAHEDHPQRALYAALRMQQALRQSAEPSAKTEEHEVRTVLEARIGINSGEVVMRTFETGGRLEYTPIGYVTNLAARLQTLAPAGGIALGEDTRRLVEGYFELRSLGPTVIKGVAEPINIFEVIGPGPLRTHFQLSTRRGLTKFVGRNEELAQLKRALEMARRGRGQIAAIVAEAGTGKSRLVHEFKATIPAGCKLLEAYSVSHGKASAWLPVLELLRGYFGVMDADDAATRREKIRAVLAALDASLADALPYLWNLLSIQEEPDPLAQMDAQIKRQRTLEALKRIVLRESLDQPVVVIFEDLHWIDSETQMLLDLMADSIANARVLMLVNYRPEYRHEWGNKSYYSQIRLEALNEQSAETMLHSLLSMPLARSVAGEGKGEGAVSTLPELDRLKRLIIQRSEGNPFFIEEMLQALFDEGVLARNGVVKITRPFSQVRLPPTVQGILAARIDRQPGEHKQLLHTLAVLGRESRLDLIREMVPIAEPQLHGVLAELQASEFIYEQPAFPQGEFVFKHALTQEVAYNSMLLEQRKALHERAGLALESLFSNQLDDYLSELARHYCSSGDSQKALHYSQLAGQQAVLRSAHTQAINHLTKALELLQTSPDNPERTHQELALLMVLAPVLMEARGYAAPEVEKVSARARMLCEQVGDASQLIQVLRILWGFHVNRGQLQTAHELAGEMLGLTNKDYNAAFLPGAHYARGLTSYFLGDFASARDHTQQAIALYEAQRLPALHSMENPKLGSLGFLAWALWFLGCPDQALSRIEQALDLSRELPRAFDRAFAAAFTAWLHQFCRQSQAAESHAETAIALSNEYGFPFWLSIGTVIRGWVLSERGKSAEGIQQILEGISIHQAMGAKTDDSWSYTLLAESYARAGRIEEGLDALTHAVETMHSTGESFYEAEVHRLQGELRAKQDASEARLSFQRAVDIARKQGAKSLELRATTSLARLLARDGRRDEAHRMLAEIYDWFTEGFDTADLAAAKSLLDELGR
jgi:class 3 adenylate cyclase/predicted ATPase